MDGAAAQMQQNRDKLLERGERLERMNENMNQMVQARPSLRARDQRRRASGAPPPRSAWFSRCDGLWPRAWSLQDAMDFKEAARKLREQQEAPTKFLKNIFG